MNRYLGRLKDGFAFVKENSILFKFQGFLQISFYKNFALFKNRFIGRKMSTYCLSRKCIKLNYKKNAYYFQSKYCGKLKQKFSRFRHIDFVYRHLFFFYYKSM